MHILIIGAGFGGLRVARELRKKAPSADITVIDRKNYFEVTYATLRTLTDPGFANGAGRVEYAAFLDAEFIQDSVVELQRNSAHLHSGKQIDFDYAVVATGTSYPSLPIAKSETSLSLASRNKEIACANQELLSNQAIRIVGAGAVGAELAGEVKARFPKTDVELYDLGDRVLQHLTPKASDIAADLLKALGVHLHLNTPINTDDDHRGLTYWCRGPKIQTGFIADDDIKSTTGELKVDSYLQVQNQPTWFAVGDAAALTDAKMGATANHQAKFVAEHLSRLGRSKSSLRRYKPQPFMSLVPIGRRSGVAQFKSITATWQPVINWKQKDLLIDYALKQVGAR